MFDRIPKLVLTVSVWMVWCLGCGRHFTPSGTKEIVNASVVPEGHSVRINYTRVTPFPAEICPEDFLVFNSPMIDGYRDFRPGESLVLRQAREGSYRVQVMLHDNPDGLEAPTAEMVQTVDISKSWVPISFIFDAGNIHGPWTALMRSADESPATEEKRRECVRTFGEKTERQAWMPPSAGKRGPPLRRMPMRSAVELQMNLSQGTTVPVCQPDYYRWPSNCDPDATGVATTVWENEELAIDTGLMPGRYDVVVSLEDRSTGSSLGTPYTAFLSRVSIGPEWKTHKIVLWPDSPWSITLEVKVRGRSLTIPDGDMCKDPEIGPSGWVCRRESTTSGQPTPDNVDPDFIKCEVQVPTAGGKKTFTEQSCHRDVVYYQLHNKICAAGLSMLWSDFDRTVSCGETPGASKPVPASRTDKRGFAAPARSSHTDHRAMRPSGRACPSTGTCGAPPDYIARESTSAPIARE